MAVIASAQITLSRLKSIDQAIYYYKKQSSTSAAPAKPTSYPPTGWSTTEPSYSSGETSTLYITICTLFSDGTFDYSDVTVSASFEAAKQAYNKAVAGEQAAGIAVTAANGKNKLFYQNDEPTSGMSEGDLWFDTDGGNAIWEYKKTSSSPETYAWTKLQLGQGSIAANSITATELNVGSLSAITANIGTITAGILKSSDYQYSSGTYTSAGMIIDLNNKLIRSKYAAILGDGKLYASAGSIGPWAIGSSGIYNGKTTLGSFEEGTYIGTTGISGSANGGSYTITPGGNFTLEDTSSSTVQTTVILNINKQSTGDYVNIAPMQLSISNYNSSQGLCGISVEYYSGVYSGRMSFYSTNGNSLDYNAREGRLEFVRTSDGALITNQYNSSPYPLIRSHNNGNISVSASGVGLYLGYENTTNLDFLHGKAAMDANGNFTALGNITSSKTSGQAAVYASNGASKNRIFMYADASNGQAGLYSYDASNAARAILVRGNNTGAVTAYGAWTFSNGVVGYNNTGRPVVSIDTNTARCSMLSASGASTLQVTGQWNSSTYSVKNITVSSSDVRLKKNILDCAIKALPVVNAMKIREFDWKDGRHQAIGFIADELEELDSRLSIGGGYSETGEMNVKSVDTFYLLGYAIKAIQELSAEINKLKGAA